jgi:hypothetical protein
MQYMICDFSNLQKDIGLDGGPTINPRDESHHRKKKSTYATIFHCIIESIALKDQGSDHWMQGEDIIRSVYTP